MKKRGLLAALAAAVLIALWSAVPAQAAFGLKELDAIFTDAAGSPAMQAGSHPFAFTTELAANTVFDPHLGFPVPEDEVKDLDVELPAGLVGTPTPVPRCSSADFASPDPADPEATSCANSTALGFAEVTIDEPTHVVRTPLYNLVPPPGAAAKFGFHVIGVPVVVEVGVNPNPPYNLVARSSNVLSQVISFYKARLVTWGIPADPVHDRERGHCIERGGSCPADLPLVPFLTLPTRCEGPLATVFKADSWEDPGAWFEETIETHGDSVPPSPLGTSDCESLAFAPQISSQPTSHSAESSSGLDFNLDVEDEGLTSANGRAASQIKKAVVTLPDGVTLNPSLAEGLATCSEAQLGAERADSKPGEGCPEASKIGTVEVETPLLEGKLLRGQLFVAAQNANPFRSLFALYLVIKDPELGSWSSCPARSSPTPGAGGS